MNDIFEQFKFLKYITDFSNPKVQECSFWGIITTFLVFISDAVRFVADTVMGVTVYFTVSLFIIMVVDLVTGLLAAKKESQKRTSKKGLRWAIKFCSYVLFIHTLNSLMVDSSRTGIEVIPVTMEIIKYCVAFHIMFWETKSIDENLERMGYSFQVFKLFDNIYNCMMNIINDKLKSK